MLTQWKPWIFLTKTKGCPKAMTERKQLFDKLPNPTPPRPCPLKTGIKYQETSGTVTHSVQGLHTVPMVKALKRHMSGCITHTHTHYSALPEC